MANADALLRQVRRIRAALDRAERDRPAAGMSAVRYPGVSGMLRQAREDAERDEHGNPVPRRTVTLDDPRPASGVAAMLWDAKMAIRERDAKRASAGLPPLSDTSSEGHAR